MKLQRKIFRVSKVAVAVATVFAAQGGINLAHAGAGWGDNTDFTGKPVKVPTFYANSPSGSRKNYNPAGGAPTVDTGSPLRKFVDTLPGLTPAGANNLGQYLPLAAADGATYPGSDYYELAVVEYQEKMHSDLPKATTLRGYVQIETPANAAVSKHIALKYPSGASILDAAGNQIYAVDNPHYLGPVVLAAKGRAVRFKFTNLLPLGGTSLDAVGKVVRNGDLFLPVDETILGAGAGPQGGKYTQNRAEIHLHGGDSPWISDGTPHQWVAPAGEVTNYKRGVSTQNVPDMPDPGEGSITYYFPNNQTARLMFYHDHSSGLTRLNVYAGEAAGYVLTDGIESNLIANGVIPGLADMIPLVIQDKTFVPKDVSEQDGRWDQDHWGQYGDLWFPHVYETNQDPNSFDGTNPVGRWDYGPWFWPVFPVDTPLPTGVYGDVTTTPEAFMDTPVVNGTAYPTLNVDPKAYRFRILNAGNDRMINLGLYVADPTVITSDGRSGTEVKMVPAAAPVAGSALAACAPGTSAPTLGAGLPCWPDYWPTDGRPEGVPDPATVGPDIVVIGNEGGFIPAPHVIPSSPVAYEMNRRSVTVLNVLTAGLFLGNAERADAVIDFSQYAGKTLILYNDSPAPVPAFDPRIDYFTGDGDQTGGGGAESTQPGYGPNTRTVMQIKVAPARVDGLPISKFDVAKLQTELPKAYGSVGGQDKPVVGESAYNAAFGTNYADTYAKIRTGSGQQTDFIWTPQGAQTLDHVQVTDGGVGYVEAPGVNISGGGGAGAAAIATVAGGTVTSVTFTNKGAGYTSAPTVTFSPTAKGGVGATASVWTSNTKSKPVQSKAIQELFDPNYGRMNATLGIELPFTTALTQTTIPLGYVDQATEILQAGETQIWKITHNGVDTHPVHFHLMNVQLINRVGWDGTIKPPKESELGWKETIKMHPLEDIIVAVSPKTPLVPFGVPESTRLRDPAQPEFATKGFTQVDLNQYLADGVTPNPSFGLTVPAGTVKNTKEFYEWEYVWHCHILGHEENDFMRPMVYRFGALPPDAPTALAVTTEGVLSWTDATPGADPATMGHKKNEIGFRVERADGAAPDAAGVVPPLAAGAVFKAVGTTLANAVTFTDTSITVGNSYWYRVVAFNAKGEATSALVSMTAVNANTPAVPAAVTATAVGSTTVNLSWTHDLKNESGFVVQRCVAAAGVAPAGPACVPGAVMTTLTTTAANITSFADTTASANTSYLYQVIAQNASAGNSAPAQSNLVSTKAAPANAPSNLVGVAASDTTATLTWTDNSSNENGFLVQRSADGGATWIDVAPIAGSAVPQAAGPALNITVVANTVTFTDSGLTQNTTYLYRVASITAGGAATSMPVTVVTKYAAAPVIGAITHAELWNQVSLSWPAAGPSTGFTVSRTGGNGPAVTYSVVGNAAGAVAANQFVDTAVVQNTSYSYTITAVNGPNVGTTSNAVTALTLYAPAPALTGLSASVASTSQVNLSWTPLNSAVYATGVRVMRCVQSAANFNCTVPTSVFTQVYAADIPANATANTIPNVWSDNTVLASTGYTYQVYFVNGPINVGASSTANASVPASFAIATPTAFTATYTFGRTRVDLSWVDGSTNETSFIVERSVDGINFAQVGAVAASNGSGSTKTYQDTLVAPGVIYYYRVKAVNVTGAVTTSSGYAGPATVDMTIGSPSNVLTAVTATQVTVTWQDNAMFQDGFAVYRSADGGATWTLAGTTNAIAGVGATGTFNDNALALVPGAAYQYAVTARWTFNGVQYESSKSSAATATVLPLPAPSNLAATFSAPGLAQPVVAGQAVSVGQISISWVDHAANETRFEVERSADGGVTWTAPVVVAARNGTGGTVTHNDVASATNTFVVGTTYQYRVKAVNVTGAVTTPSAAVTTSLVYDKPQAPASLTATAVAGQIVNLSWPAATPVTGYSVNRRRIPTTGTAPAYSNWRTVGATTLTTSDTNVTAGQVMQYEVRANNDLGSSGWVESLTATVLP